MNFSYTPQFFYLLSFCYNNSFKAQKAGLCFLFKNYFIYECMIYYNKRSLFRHDQSRLRVDGHYFKSHMGRCMTEVDYGWMITILSRLQVDDQKGDEALKFGHLN